MLRTRIFVRGIRFKYCTLIRRLLSNFSLIFCLLVIAIITFIVIGDYENEQISVFSKLDEFQSALKSKEDSSSNEIVSTKSDDSLQHVTVKVMPHSTNTKVFDTTLTLPQDQVLDGLPPDKPPMDFPIIKFRYHKQKDVQTSKTQSSNIITPKKLTNRDVLNALPRPQSFTITQGPVFYKSGKKYVAYGGIDWVRANNPKDRHKFLVYSAYWDDRFEHNNNIRVIAVMVTKFPPAVFCRLQMADGKEIDAQVVKKVNNEHWKLRYSSVFISCEVGKNIKPPLKVFLSLNRNFTYSAILPVHQNKENVASPRGNLAVCVKPLHYFYDRATWLLEFIEFHRVLGVEHFYFYNHTVGPNVNLLLRGYVTQNVVTVLPWNLPVVSQKEIRTEGIFSSLNECVLRTMYLFHYVIMLDFDEYIVPRDHEGYLEMLQELEKQNKHIRGKAGSFVFRNTFFYLYWENDTTVYGFEPEKPPQWIPYLITQYKTRRLSSSMKVGSRSKYIIVPERVLEVGNHVVWRHTSGSRAIAVPETTALLHHYRICEFGGFACLKKNSVVDRTTTKFGAELLKRVMRQCRITYQDVEEICPLSPPLGSPW